jgi:lipoprotein Spr
MKHFNTILSTCISVVFFASCSTTRPMGSTAKNNAAPEFIEGVTLNGGSSTVRITQKKQEYKNQKAPIFKEDEEPEVARKSVIEEIRYGKKQNERLYSFIEEWYGTPYRLGGNAKSGIDCSAFVKELYERVYHTELLRTSGEQFNNSSYISDQGELQEGDLVFFKIRSRRITHVGIYLANGRFVHASSSKGVVISDLSDSYWKRYYAGGGRVNNFMGRKG